MSLPIRLRAPETERELNFVRSSWTSSIVHELARECDGGCDAPKKVRHMRTSLLTWGHNRHVDAVLKAGARVLVADPIAAPGTLAGWICFEPTHVHYIYVGQTFRRLGVARMLVGGIAQKPMTYATWTPIVARLKVPALWQWDESRRWT